MELTRRQCEACESLPVPQHDRAHHLLKIRTPLRSHDVQHGVAVARSLAGQSGDRTVVVDVDLGPDADLSQLPLTVHIPIRLPAETKDVTTETVDLSAKAEKTVEAPRRSALIAGLNDTDAADPTFDEIAQLLGTPSSAELMEAHDGPLPGACSGRAQPCGDVHRRPLAMLVTAVGADASSRPAVVHDVRDGGDWAHEGGEPGRLERRDQLSPPSRLGRT